MTSLKLIWMLKISHGVEIGAINAYEGHAKSIGDRIEKYEIKQIQREEVEHKKIIEFYLEKLGSKPSKLIDFTFYLIGNLMGLLCFVMGKRLPMYGAGLIETLGVMNYDIVAKEAQKLGRHSMVFSLRHMAQTELEHKQYFQRKYAKRGPRPSTGSDLRNQN